MPTTLKDAAQTYVGVNVIAFEKLSDAVKDATGDLDERVNDARTDLDERVTEARKDLDDRISSFRSDVDSRLKASKKVAKSNTKKMRARIDPAAERFEAQLPYRVAQPLENARLRTWDFFEVKAPKKAKKAEKAAKAAAAEAPKAAAKA